MTQVSITKAAALAGVSRSTLYRSYINNGKISVETDHQGNPAIDISELLRVFNVLHEDDSDKQQGGRSKDVADTIATLEAELSKAKTLLEAREGELRKAEEREAWLREMLTRAQTQLTNQQAKPKPWWRFW
jgi:hypothetical protein